MKKILAIMMTVFMSLALGGCSDSSSAEKTTDNKTALTGQKAEAASPAADNVKAAGSKTLIVYYSRSGNTEFMAELIKAQTGGDMVRLEPVKPYPTDYDQCVELAKQELAANARPAVKTKISNMEQYDTVFIGYPNWWGTMPMPFFTFLSEYDFANKRIIPFSTSGGSGLGQGPADIKSLCPNAEIATGLTIRSNAVKGSQAETEVKAWLSGLGF